MPLINEQWPLPETLPRFAASFRVLIDKYGHKAQRMLTSEWMSGDGSAYDAWREQYGPDIMKAGFVSIIATTCDSYCLSKLGGNLKAYYGRADYPHVYWHPTKDGLKIINTDKVVNDWIAAYNTLHSRGIQIDRRVFDTPRWQEVRR